VLPFWFLRLRLKRKVVDKQRNRKERALRRRRERETRVTTKPKRFTVQDFLYNELNARCICPAGHKLYCSGKNMLFNGYRVASFKAPKTACRGCHLRELCLRHPDRTPQRQLTIIKHPEGPPPRRRPSRSKDAAKRMRWKFDTPLGQEIYSRRMGTVEPVFANLQNKGMRRFTLRGQRKVSASQPESTNRPKPTRFHWKVRPWWKAGLALASRVGFSTASLSRPRTPQPVEGTNATI